ncbi:hypothetical protein BC828DRAFT_380287 [Blastocladiella britannica]|nr:hypothetical protein BC828DRAFT_380287 [Blastocladiella britannica]
MLRNKAFVKKKRGGGIVSVVKEHYLRDDIYCGSLLCSVCPNGPTALLSRDPPTADRLGKHYLVPDTNVFLHHMDLMDHPAIMDVVVAQTVLEEVRHRNLTTYNRLRTLIANRDRRYFVFSNEHHRDTFAEKIDGESPNDRNDRAIRMVADWYQKHLANTGITVLMLSDDAGNRQFAQTERIRTLNVARYAEACSSVPQLVDLVANRTELPDASDPTGEQYPEHWSSSLVASALARGQLYQGTLQVASHNVFEGHILATISPAHCPPGYTQTDNKLLISGRTTLNRAVHGDVVAVEILPFDQWSSSAGSILREDDAEATEEAAEKLAAESEPKPVNHAGAVPTGRIVSIIKRNWRPFCGTIDPSFVPPATTGGPLSVYVFPIDRRVPKIRIRTRQAAQLVGQRIIVNIDAWERQSRYPVGHFVKLLGPSLDKETETEVILLEHGVPYEPFSAAVLKDLPAEGEAWLCSPEELARRRDLRHLPVCSIDPPGCTDIDDALHVRKLPNGNFEVGVHIADVTHFVQPKTAMDTEAAKRGTTVYLVDKRIDMLPALLGTNLCSLRSNVDRLAFSCLWEMSPDANIIKVEYTKSIIHSKASFTYEEAQKRIDDVRQQDEVTIGVRILNSLAKQLKQRRLDNGALTLASPEVRFRLEGDAQDPVDVELKELKETNALVEEFMLLANVSVAEKIFATFPNSAMLRCHPTPPAESFGSLLQALARFGLDLNVSSSKALSESLDLAVSPTDPYFNQLVRIMTTRCMMQAQYFCSGMLPREQFRHYGLAMPIYTHFTSPIRRYADVTVHRLLAASIAQGTLHYGEELTDKDALDRLADNLNFRNRMAQQAGRSSVELFTHVYFKGKVLFEPAYVTRVHRNGISTLIPKYGVEANISLDPAVWKYDAGENAQTSADGGLMRLFDGCTVRIEVVEVNKGSGSQKVEMTLVAGAPAAPAAAADGDAMEVDVSPPAPMPAAEIKSPAAKRQRRN